jgi:phosphoribosylglycinamide formyltransferase 1
MGKILLAVLASGQGSNLQAIIDAVESGKIYGSIGCVISDKPDAFGLERANKHGIEAIVIDNKKYADKQSYESELIKVLEKKNPDLVCLAGYMRIVGPEMIKKFKNKIINIHPALLPSFPGLHGQKQAVDYGVKISGCTVHFVDEGCDTGPVILQSAVPVLEGDDEFSLSKRILDEEHKLYPKAIQLFAEGKLKIEGRKVKISN